MVDEYMTSKNFKVWVNDNYNSYLQFEKTSKNVKCYVYPETGTTVIVNTATLKSARSKCTYPDIFDTNTGVAIAWARYQNKTVPTIIKRKCPLKEVTPGDDFIMTDPRTGLYGSEFTFLGAFANNFQNYCIMRKADDALFSMKGDYLVGILE